MGKQSKLKRLKFEKVQAAREIEGLVKRARLFDRIKWDGKWQYNVIDCNNVAYQFFEIYKGKQEIELSQAPIKPPFPRMYLELAEFNTFGAVVEREDVVNVMVALMQEDDRIIDLARANLFLLNDGYCQDARYELSKNPKHSNLTDREFRTLAEEAMGMIFLSMQLLNCRNVQLIDGSPDPTDSVLFERYFGKPMTKYKTLAIKPMGKSGSGDNPQQQFDVMPLHLRRGNFAHYSDNAPLFGKYTGTFWRPATVVGNEKNGLVVKDYKVKP